MLLFGAFLLYKFSGVFTVLGDTATAAAAAATERATQKMASASDHNKVASAAPAATDEQIAAYKADAITLASAMGTGPGYTNFLIPDLQTGFSVLKRRSRLMLYNNKPYDVTTHKTQAVEHSNSARRRVNLAALVPFYKEYTGGKDMYSDIRRIFNKGLFGNPYAAYLKWIL